MNRKLLILCFFVGMVACLTQCQPDDTACNSCPDPSENPVYPTTPYQFEIPAGFPEPFIPSDNPMTVEGVNLGRYLFFDKNLSKDRSMSCGSCHLQTNMFADPAAHSIGVNGQETRRHSMVLFNLAWQEKFFWDGRAGSLEEQIVIPVTDPVELDSDWPTVISRIQSDPVYDSLFIKAFGKNEVNKEMVAKAIAQYIRTMVSADSKFDRVARLKTESWDTDLQQIGYDMFRTEQADCFHCHGEKETSFLLGAFGEDLTFLNNGSIKNSTLDKGREEVTADPLDFGAFKVPSLRNIGFSAPYFHDGSIPTLDSLIEFYNMGGHTNKNIDPNMRKAGVTFPRWTEGQKRALKAFLLSLTDYNFYNDTIFSDPRKTGGS